MSKVELITRTPWALEVACVAAGRCYSDQTNDSLEDEKIMLPDEKLEKYIKGIIKTGHTSVIEHVSFTFAIEGVSRSFLAQITRHRLASFSVQSQRYVRIKSDNSDWYIIPPSIYNNEETREVFNNHMKNSIDAYNKICDTLVESGKTNEEAMEDARFVLPEATETKMIVTMNARELLHFFELRCCNRAQWEIRDVANKMLEEVKKFEPWLGNNAGPSCVVHGVCPEGKRGCGKNVNSK